MPAESCPSSSILLISPDQVLQQVFRRSVFSHCHIDVCSSKQAVTQVPLALYQLIICPHHTAVLDQYSLFTLSRGHNPCAPFIVTMTEHEYAFAQQAIQHGALGLLDESPTARDVIRTVEPLLWLYRLRIALVRRQTWLNDFGKRLRDNPVHGKSKYLLDNRVMCLQSMLAMEGSMEAMQGHAKDLVADAKERMRCYNGQKMMIQ